LSSLEIVRLSTAFGIVAAAVQILILVVQRFGFSRFVVGSPHVVWMAPAANVILMTALCVGAIACARAIGRAVPTAVLLGLGFALVLGGPLLQMPRINTLAAGLLTLGLSVQLARVAAPHDERVRVAVQRTAAAAALLLAVATLWVSVGPGLRERRATRDLSPANHPNILLLVLDTVRAASLGLYGHTSPTTPNLERLAERGLVFEQAWTVSPWTRPSHASMFTGRWGHELSPTFVEPLDDAYPTLAEFLAGRGYRTGGFVANLDHTSRHTGLARGFQHYEDIPVSPGLVARSAWIPERITLWAREILGFEDDLVRKRADGINDALIAWIFKGEGGAPFFAFANYYDAHAPYLPPDSLQRRFGPPRTGRALIDVERVKSLSPAELLSERAAYEASIAFIDQQLGLLFDTLASSGVLENTVVVVTSDHGEQFGEHGLYGHANSLYSTALHVPLLIVPPGERAGRRLAHPVSLRDLAATVSELGGFEDHPFPGSSLVSSASTPSPLVAEVRDAIRPADWVPTRRGDIRSLFADGWHYIRNGDGVEELYRLDPSSEVEQDVVVSEPEVVARMRARVDSVWLSER
jgi:arylsulfatase A-like enzyme